MTPAEALEELLPRWKSSLPAEFSAEVVDDFVRRKRSVPVNNFETRARRI